MDKQQLILPHMPSIDSQLDEYAIRHTYESILDRCARLVAYAQLTPRHTYWPVIDRQDQLATDDIIVFALHARRFINSTSLVSLAHNVVIPQGPLGRSAKYVSIWRIFSTIIHNNSIDIYRTKQDFVIILKMMHDIGVHLSDFIRDDMMIPIKPQIFVSSDHFMVVFDLGLLLDRFHNRILRVAVDNCRNQGLELTELDRDMEKITEVIMSFRKNQRFSL